ncbi:MOB kinase activator-like 2 isoform X2 [Chrysoperla carnea]|uniref:MOB kinase activator-like 2 isoform X2 n=1 Tax=Chrysoperla carnea TaxID=189513 RepID=UPI001D079C95|nr:MOB kinase activator-like 2 isoform X2 [Chrysoperla carnea]
MGKARRKEREGGGDSGTAGQSGDPKLYLEATVLERKLPDADLRLLVDLPPGLDYNEWLASHTMALFDHVNLVYGTVSEFCTMSGCPDMTGPGQRTYLWFDEKGKKTRVAAPQYIDYVMTFIQKTVSDESIFPTKYANEFPVSFESIVRKIIRLLFHVVAHLYAAHFREVVLLGLHAHLNLTFAHLTALQHRFSLIEPKETEVLRDLELALRLSEDSNNTTTTSTSTTSTVGVTTSTNTTTSSSITPTNSSNNSNSGCQQEQILLPPSTELATEATASMDLETSLNNSTNSSSQPMSQSIITQPPESIINVAPRINNTEHPELTHA